MADVIVNEPIPSEEITVNESSQNVTVQSTTETSNVSEQFLLPPEVIAQEAAIHRNYARMWASNPIGEIVEDDKYSALHYADKAKEFHTTILSLTQEIVDSVNHADSQILAYTTAAEKAQQWAERQPNIQVEPGKYSARHYAVQAANVLNALSTASAQLESVVNNSLAQAIEIQAGINAIDLAAINTALDEAETSIAAAQTVLANINASATAASNAANTAITARDATTAARDITVAARDTGLDTYENLVELSEEVERLASGAFFNALSTTAVPLGLGVVSITLTEATREHFAPSAWLQMVNPSNGRIAQAGTLLGYNPITGVLTMEIYQYYGTGTHSNWIIAPTPSPFLPVIIDAGVFDGSPEPTYEFVEHRVAALTAGSVGSDGGLY